MSQLVTAMSLALPDGTPVPLLVPGYRHIKAVDGLAGMSTRTVIVPNNGRQGSRSRTRFRDDRPITITGFTLGGGGVQPDRAWDEYWSIASAFSGAIDTDRELAYTLGFGRELVSLVRFEGDPISLNVTGGNMVPYTATLRATDPRAYEPQWITRIAVPLAGGAGGDIYPSTYPIHYRPPVSTTVQIDNPGSVETPLIITINGYLLNPIIRFGTREMIFNAEIAQGDQLVINTRDRTVLLNNESNRRSLLDTARSRWFDAPPGITPLQLLAADSQPGAGITVQYRIARQ